MRKQVKIPLLIFILSLNLLTGCDDEFPDYYNEKEFEVEGFEGVKLGDAFQIEIERSSGFSLIAGGENKDLEELKVEVVNGILIVNYQPGTRNHKRTLLKISMPVLKKAEFHSASSSVISGFENTEDDLQIKVSGASRVVTDMEGNIIDLSVDGASELIFKGSAEKLNARVKGASRLQASELTVNTAIVEVGGSSEASVNAAEILSGEVGGHSLLRYRGNPEIINVEVSVDSQMLPL